MRSDASIPLATQAAQPRVSVERIQSHQPAQQQSHPSITIALQRDVTTPKLAQWHREVRPWARTYSLIVEDLGFKIPVSALLSAKLGQRVVVIVDEMLF